jgi:hypothetical protein
MWTGVLACALPCGHAALGVKFLQHVELSLGLGPDGFVGDTWLAWFWACDKINNSLDTRNLIPNGASQPGNGVLPGRIVANTCRVDT